MTKFNCFLITVFFILSFVKSGYCDNEQNCFQVIKNIPVSYGKIFETNIINEEKPDIIIINDLHSNSFAQKNIYSII